MDSPGPDHTTTYRVVEQTRTPLSSVVLAFGPMLPFVAGALAVWFGRGGEPALAAQLTGLWGGAILAFLAGVRRGLTFRSPDGETVPQLVTMAVLFGLAVVALLLNPSRLSLAVLMAGFAALAWFDSRAARREEAPPYFARLRPVQMVIPVLALGAIALKF